MNAADSPAGRAKEPARWKRFELPGVGEWIFDLEETIFPGTQVRGKQFQHVLHRLWVEVSGRSNCFFQVQNGLEGTECFDLRIRTVFAEGACSIEEKVSRS